MLNISNPDNMDLGGSSAKATPAPRLDPAEALKRVQDTMQNEDIDLLKVLTSLIALMIDRSEIRDVILCSSADNLRH